MLVACGVEFNPTPAHCSDVCVRVVDQGYPCECHDIVTSDGFVLQSVRISGRQQLLGGDPVVWLQHGFEGSCVDWISNPSTSDNLAYMLHDAGFDVWMGNSRGNVFAFQNTRLSISSKEFWSAVDIDTMASIDTPTVIDYVLRTTNQRGLSWVGHSQGTTQMFAALSRQYTLQDGRHIADVLDTVAMMAPVAYVHHSTSLLLQVLAGFHVEHLDALLGDRDFLGPKVTVLLHAVSLACKPIPQLCPTVNWPIMGGGNFSNRDPRTYRNATRYDPSDTSVHNLEHWTQLMRKERFGMFDYGKKVNLQKYNSTSPPHYDLTKISGVRMAIFNGAHDDIGDLKDVAILLDDLPSRTVIFHKELEHYGHMDFIWGKDARAQVYDPLVDLLSKKTSPVEFI